MVMYASGSGCFCPVHPVMGYGIRLVEEDTGMASLELIDKQKNGFGEVVYCIRDQDGSVSMIHESNLSDFMRKQGVSVLNEGKPFVYPLKK